MDNTGIIVVLIAAVVIGKKLINESLLFKIGVGISVGINLFIFTALLYNIKRYDKRVDENRKWLKEP